jgi:hypothetical protein
MEDKKDLVNLESSNETLARDDSVKTVGIGCLEA